MNDFYRGGLQGRQDFASIMLTLLITMLVLIISSMGTIYIYQMQTGSVPENTIALTEHFGRNGLFALQLFPSLTSLVTLLLCVRYLHQRPILSVITSRSALDWYRVRFSALIWLIFLLVFFGYDYLVEGAIRWNYQGFSFWWLVVLCILLIPAQTLFEEVLFRGYLLQAFGGGIQRKWVGILLSSLFFTGMHLGNPELDAIGYSVLLYYFASGLMMSIVTTLDGGIELSFGFHFINNFFGAVFLTNDWQVFQTDALYRNTAPPQLNLAFWLTIVLVFPFLMYLYGRKFRFSLRALLK